MLYLDTSLVVPLFTNEVETTRSHDWLAIQSPEKLAISDWVITEFAAAIAMKVRLKVTTLEQGLASQAWFDRVKDSTFAVWSVDRSCFERAADLAGRSRLGLRGGDALHLAVIDQRNATLCTRDRGMASCAQELALPTVLL